jgi:hypothetical protein
MISSKFSLAACSNWKDFVARFCRLLHHGEVRSIASLARMLFLFWRHIEPFRPLSRRPLSIANGRLVAPSGAVKMQMRNFLIALGTPK